MDLNERFNVLVQGVEIAQKSGVLSLDNAVEAKNCIDKIQKGEDLKESLGLLVKICETTQKGSPYSLQDAHLLFMASDGINIEIDNFIAQAQKQQAEQQPSSEQPNQEIKVTTDDNNEWGDKIPDAPVEPAKKESKRKK